MEENKSLAESVGLEEYAKQNPEVQHLIEMLNSQNMSFDDFVNSDPELQKTMKVLTEENIKLGMDQTDDDLELKDEDDLEPETEIGAISVSANDLMDTSESDENTSSVNTTFNENVENTEAVSNDLNSIF